MALVAAVALGACAERSAPDLLAAARQAMAAQDATLARQHLRAAVDLAPGEAQAHFLLGQLMRQEGNMLGAEGAYARARDNHHPPDEVVPLLAEAMLANGKARLVVQQFGSTRLDDAQARIRLDSALAQAAADTGQSDDARRQVDALLERQPDLFPALALRARLLAEAGDTSQARAVVTQMLQRQPDSVDAWQLKGDVLARAALARPPLADVADAVAAYRQVLQRRPDAVTAHAGIVSAYLDHHDLTAAIVQWNAMLQVAPRHPRTWLLEVLISNERRDYPRARDVAQRLLRYTPDDAQVRLLAGEAALRLDDLAQARIDLGKAVQLAPWAPRQRLLLAQVLLRQGQAEKALAIIEPLVERADAGTEALLVQARALQQAGDGVGAEAAFARVAARRPDDPEARTALALHDLDQGRNLPQAQAALRQLAAADKGSGTDRALIDTLLARQDVDGARQAVQALAAKAPEDRALPMLQARVALAAQDTQAARRHFTAALSQDADAVPAQAGLAALDLADGQPALAKARYESVLQRNDRSVPAWLALADLNSRTGGPPAETERLLGRAVAADPGAAEPRVLLVDHFLRNNDTKAAVDAARSGLGQLADNADLLDRLGRAQLLLGEPLQAVATYTRMVSVTPRSAQANLRLAEALVAGGRQASATAAFERAAELAPDLPAVQQALAEALLRENRPERALALAQRIQAQRPDQATGWLIESEVALRRRDGAGAIAALRQAAARPQPGVAPARLHAALLAAQRHAEAESMARDWRRNHPGDLVFALHLAAHQLSAGRAEAAEALYGDVLRRQPGNPAAQQGLARILAQQRRGGAVALAERALAAAPQSAPALETLALALASEQQLRRAVDVQREALAAAPTEHQRRLQLARLLVDSGDKAAARMELNLLTSLGKRFDQQAEVQALLRQAE